MLASLPTVDSHLNSIALALNSDRQQSRALVQHNSSLLSPLLRSVAMPRSKVARKEGGSGGGGAAGSAGLHRRPTSQLASNALTLTPTLTVEQTPLLLLQPERDYTSRRERSRIFTSGLTAAAAATSHTLVDEPAGMQNPFALDSAPIRTVTTRHLSQPARGSSTHLAASSLAHTRLALRTSSQQSAAAAAAMTDASDIFAAEADDEMEELERRSRLRLPTAQPKRVSKPATRQLFPEAPMEEADAARAASPVPTAERGGRGGAGANKTKGRGAKKGTTAAAAAAAPAAPAAASKKKAATASAAPAAAAPAPAAAASKKKGAAPAAAAAAAGSKSSRAVTKADPRKSRRGESEGEGSSESEVDLTQGRARARGSQSRGRGRIARSPTPSSTPQEEPEEEEEEEEEKEKEAEEEEEENGGLPLTKSFKAEVRHVSVLMLKEREEFRKEIEALQVQLRAQAAESNRLSQRNTTILKEKQALETAMANINRKLVDERNQVTIKPHSSDSAKTNGAHAHRSLSCVVDYSFLSLSFPQVRDLHSLIQVRDKKLAKLESSLDDKTKQVSALEKQSRQIENTLTKVQRSYALLETDFSMIMEEKQQQENTIGQLQEQAKMMEAQIAKQNAEKAELMEAQQGVKRDDQRIKAAREQLVKDTRELEMKRERWNRKWTAGQHLAYKAVVHDSDVQEAIRAESRGAAAQQRKKQERRASRGRPAAAAAASAASSMIDLEEEEQKEEAKYGATFEESKDGGEGGSGGGGGSIFASPPLPPAPVTRRAGRAARPSGLPAMPPPLPVTPPPSPPAMAAPAPAATPAAAPRRRSGPSSSEKKKAGSGAKRAGSIVAVAAAAATSASLVVQTSSLDRLPTPPNSRSVTPLRLFSNSNGGSASKVAMAAMPRVALSALAGPAAFVPQPVVEKQFAMHSRAPKTKTKKSARGTKRSRSPSPLPPAATTPESPAAAAPAAPAAAAAAAPAIASPSVAAAGAGAAFSPSLSPLASPAINGSVPKRMRIVAPLSLSQPLPAAAPEPLDMPPVSPPRMIVRRQRKRV